MNAATQEAVLHHVNGTNALNLERAAANLDVAYDALWRLRGRIAGLRVDTISTWDSESGRSIRSRLETIEATMAQMGGQLSLVADRLHAHAAQTTTTHDEAEAEAVRAFQEPGYDLTASMARILPPFQDSVRAFTESLWEHGALVPGAIPLPQGPWVDSNGGVAEPGEIPYGRDEWGNLVPAYQAVEPALVRAEPIESGVPIGALLRWLFQGGRRGAAAGAGRAVAPTADDLAALVKSSYGWRAAHIDRHIREWYRLADDAPVQPWMREEFLKLVVDSGMKQGKVFRWSLRGEQGAQPTSSVLRFDQSTGRWLVSQYYLAGERAGEFATAFEPTARQLARMLQQSAMG